MNTKFIKSLLPSLLMVSFALFLNSCSNTAKEETNTEVTESTIYPSDVIPFMDKFKILLGDGTNSDELIDYADEDFFYAATEGETNWVVYKTPNSGTTSKNSSNTRSGSCHQAA